MIIVSLCFSPIQCEWEALICNYISRMSTSILVFNHSIFFPTKKMLPLVEPSNHLASSLIPIITLQIRMLLNNMQRIGKDKYIICFLFSHLAPTQGVHAKHASLYWWKFASIMVPSRGPYRFILHWWWVTWEWLLITLEPVTRLP